jgi:hypothetical protein
VKAEPGVVYRTAKNANGTFPNAFPAQSCYGAELPAQVLSLVHGAKISVGTQITLTSGSTAATTARMRFLHADGWDHGGKYNENSLVVRSRSGRRTASSSATPRASTTALGIRPRRTRCRTRVSSTESAC